MSREQKGELIAELMRVFRAHEAASDAFDELAARKLGLNRTDVRCMGIIENEGPMTAGRLAERSGLTTAAVTSILDRLENAGYARRVRDENDRRQVIVEPTPLVEERAGPIWGPLGQEGEAYMSRMSVAELERMIEFLRWGIELNERHMDRIRKLEFD
jgi:DNA-binding MarR family transcriptional regulator